MEARMGKPSGLSVETVSRPGVPPTTLSP